ncbi:MAG: hypothetical protein GY805_36120 [Chloroflexi bacterium]|nr:hypothetical protein [Chloroflexota bacterium]
MNPLSKQIIDADQPLSQSLIWQIQRAYFLKNGMKAWQDDVVPSSISSNPVMARAYSQILFGYLRDCFAAARGRKFALDETQPIYIVELGAGSGRLAHYFLHTFYPRYLESPFAKQPIKYVMTDFVPEIVTFWQENGRFQPWVDENILDFALFDVQEMRPLTLRNSDEVLTPDKMQNPIVLIANYFFDSIPQDSFVIEEGHLCQNLLTLSSSQSEPDLADPIIWERLKLNYEPIPLQKPYYSEPLYDHILDNYEANLADANFSFPNVGLDCLRYWQGFGNGRNLLLTSDRGYTQIEGLLGQEDPLPNLHGSFSLMVNYHAIGQYVLYNEGVVCQVPHYQDNIQVLAYLLGEIPQAAQETRHAFTAAVGQGGPDDFFALKSVAEKQIKQMSLPQLLSFLRLSGWDADVFANFLPHFTAELKTADPVWYPDVQNALNNILHHYLPLNHNDPLPDKMYKLLEYLTKKAG